MAKCITCASYCVIHTDKKFLLTWWGEEEHRRFKRHSRREAGRGLEPLQSEAQPHLSPQIKWHFIQGSMQSHHFESRSASLIHPCRPLILKSLATYFTVMVFQLRAHPQRWKRGTDITIAFPHRELSTRKAKMRK